MPVFLGRASISVTADLSRKFRPGYTSRQGEMIVYDSIQIGGLAPCGCLGCCAGGDDRPRTAHFCIYAFGRADDGKGGQRAPRAREVYERYKLKHTRYSH